MVVEHFNPFSLSGKKVLVTGASSGIGRSIAIACAKMGAQVFLTARDHDRLKETLSMIPSNGHQMLIADLTIQNELEKLASDLPVLDGVVHSAGIGSRLLCKFVDKESIDTVFAPNFQAPVLLQATLLNQHKINKKSSVVFISSRAVSAPSIGNGIYSASKGALTSYAKVLALELAPRQVRVNCICPGMVWTKLIIQDGITKEEMENAQLKYPLKRFGKPEDVAYLSVYLLSDASDWMTGACLDLSGGGEGLLTL